MFRTHAAGLLLLALSAACSPGRQPVASAPAPAQRTGEAPTAPVLETVTPVDEGLVLRGAPAPVGADLLGDKQYDLPVVPNEWVRTELEFLVGQRHAVVGGWLRAADRYDEWVRDVFASYGIPRDLHHLGMIESGYRATVRSHAGAVGMWQFMPATGRQMGLRIDTLVDERMDPIRATHAAARHLRYLHRQMRGDWALAAAAYNAGEGRINRAMGRYGATDFWDVAARGNLAQETRRYVPRLYAVTIIAKDPVRFGYPAPEPAGRRFAFDSMRVDLATPLSVLAQMGNLPVNELLDLNPHLFRQIAPRNYQVWVPLGQGAPLQQAFATSEFRQRGGFGVYRVREGESLSRLAELSGVPADRIRAMNLSTNLDNLRAGDRLRLYADAVRVLDARPSPRVASSSRRGPRVLGDPTPGSEAESASSTEARRNESSSSRRSESASSSERRNGSSASERSSGSSSSRSSEASSSERRSGESASSSERRSGSSASSSTSGSSERRSGTTAASTRRDTASASTRRSGSSTSERSGTSEGSTSERRSGSASSSSSRTSSAAREESGASRATERASSSSSTSASSARRSGTASGGAAGRTHTVEDGETLWGIARRFDVTVVAVREANGLDEDDTIQPGQALRIPRASSASSTASASATTRESGNRASSGSTASSSTARESGSRASTGSTASSSTARESGSRASSGSTGERRASTETASGQRRGSTASESRPALSTVNRMPARREHTVADGETLWGIARRYETTVENLRRANDLAEDAQIRPGQKLRIPN
ncbi:LysM peptidoglycan-binding domain-containing protein [Longimicrobium sp.]|uniref:LysM peptidoglycan-binding domain-containing protein n=1 Tax=Longimicrobium sp. TaxID=2029185 RepID=UPI003B3A0C62